MTWMTSAKVVAAAAILSAATPGQAADETDKKTMDEVKAALDELKTLKSSPQQTINANSLAIESWLLTSTAVDATADKIHSAVSKESNGHLIVVLAGTEALEASQVPMLRMEMASLLIRLGRASSIQCTTQRLAEAASTANVPIAAAAALIDLLKSQTELTPITQSVDAKLLAASVASKFPGQAIIPSAAIASGTEGQLLQTFRELAGKAVDAQRERDNLAANQQPSDCEKDKLRLLNAALTTFDTFYARVTTAKDGVVPIIVADRLDRIFAQNALVLRVNTEGAGGTLLKRTNLITALGGETAFVSGGLVSSYQLTNPASGSMIRAGIVTCRTTLTSLKRVQSGSWSTPDGRTRASTAICRP